MTSRQYTESATPDSTKRYASDLDDQEFAIKGSRGRRYSLGFNNHDIKGRI